jgi:hypothetical protein
MKLLTFFLLVSAAWGQMVQIGTTRIPSTSPEPSASIASAQTQTIATGERLALVQQLAQSGTYTKIAVYLGAISGCTACVLRASLQTVDASGNPSGSYYGGSNYGEVTSPTQNAWNEITFGTAVTGAKGDYIAIVIEYGATAATSITVQVAPTSGLRLSSSVYTKYTAGAWTAAASRLGYGSSFLLYSTKWVSAPGGWSMPRLSYTLSSASNAFAGNKITLPFAVSVTGVFCSGSGPVGVTSVAELYVGVNTAEGQAVATASFDSDATYAGGNYLLQEALFATPVVVPANTPMVAGFKNNSSNTVISHDVGGGNTAYAEAAQWGTSIHMAYRSSGGSLSYTTTKMIMCGILVDGVGVGSGGFSTVQ